MLKIRLQRVGRKHEPTFRVVLTESENSTKSGRFHEVLGAHDPRRKEATELKADRIQYWIGKGAQVTPTMHNMLVTKGIIKGKKINVLPKKTVAKVETPAEAPAPKAAPAAEIVAPAAEATPVAEAAAAPEIKVEATPETPAADTPTA